MSSPVTRRMDIAFQSSPCSAWEARPTILATPSPRRPAVGMRAASSSRGACDQGQGSVWRGIAVDGIRLWRVGIRWNCDNSNRPRAGDAAARLSSDGDRPGTRNSLRPCHGTGAVACSGYFLQAGLLSASILKHASMECGPEPVGDQQRLQWHLLSGWQDVRASLPPPHER